MRTFCCVVVLLILSPLPPQTQASDYLFRNGHPLTMTDAGRLDADLRVIDGRIHSIKELWVNLLAYNVIRLLMAQAALESGLHSRELSFKHTVQIWTQWLLLRPGLGLDWQRDNLLKLIAQVRLGH